MTRSFQPIRTLSSGAIDVLTSLHTGKGAVICFHGEGMKALGAIPAESFRQKWKTISPCSSSEMYFSINSTYQQFVSAKYPTGLFSSRKRDSMRYANALFVDIDPDSGQDVNELQSRAESVRISAGLPVPTFTVHSGRGLWYLWAFTQPLSVHGDKLDQWTRAAVKLSDIFLSAGADRPASTDITRVMRVPGSRNQKTGARVRFLLTGPKHDFFALVSNVGLEIRKTPVTPNERPRVVKNAAKQKAVRERWRRMFMGLEKLVQQRKRIPEQQRSWAIFCFAMTMHRAGLPQGLIEYRCRELGQSVCFPPLDANTIERKIVSGVERRSREKGYMSFKTLRRIFAVTADELNRIPELQPRTKPVPQHKGQKIRNAIHLLIAEHGFLPCASDLLSLLTSKGFKTSRASVYRYLKKPELTGLMSKTPILKISVRKNESKASVLAEGLRTARLAHRFEVLTGGAGRPVFEVESVVISRK